MNTNQITISMATIPNRMTGMCQVVETLLPTCDNFDIYLNDYPGGFHLPVFDDPKVTVRRGEDLGARGKFFAAHRTPGYFLTVDDDIIYPPDYTYKMIQAIDYYGRQAVVGTHGVIMGEPANSMQPVTRTSRIFYPFFRDQQMDTPVHLLGTGVMGYHTDTLTIDWREMLPGKIDDQVARLLQREHVPAMCLAHRGSWILDNDEHCLKQALRRNTDANLKALQRVYDEPWTIYLPDVFITAQDSGSICAPLLRG